MQILEIFTVYDSAAAAYITPFFLPNQDMATRSFSDCVNDFGHSFNKHPHDYTLFRIGNFNVSTGIMECDVPQALGNGVTFKRIPSSEPQMDIEEQIQREAMESEDKAVSPFPSHKSK